METIEITKILISIPSFVDTLKDESKLAEWIYGYLKINSELKITKQFINERRSNVIAANSNNPEILVVGHMDTVQPKSGWQTNPFNPVEKERKIYGLGASDMKAGLAVMLQAATQKEIDRGTMFLFYCDEEYDFLGMKKFIKKYKNKIKPRYILSADGEAGKIGLSCRGLIEITVKFQGKSGHSACPKTGINAITQSQKILNDMEKWLNKFNSNQLGNSTLNVAYIKGGTEMGNNVEIVLGREGNIIPDYCEIVLEIRNASQKLKAEMVKQFLAEESKKYGLKIIDISTRHDLGCWLSEKQEVEKIIGKLDDKKILNAKDRGYVDLQMLWATFNQVPCLTVGAGESGVTHKENEFVTIDNLKKTENFYRKIIC